MKNNNGMVVCFSMVDWDGLKQRPQHIMENLSKDQGVLYIENIGLRRVNYKDIPLLLKKLTKFLGQNSHMTKLENLTILSPFILPIFRNSFIVKKFNNAILLKQIKNKIQNKDLKSLTIWIYSPSEISLSVAKKLNPKTLIYDCVDEMADFPGVDREKIIACETQLVKDANIVFTTARRLYDRLHKLNLNTYLVGNGVDGEIFFSPKFRDVPELETLKRPIIGFVGAIHEWVDIDLIEYVASTCTDTSIVIVGPLGNGVDIKKLEKMPHVLYLGEKSNEDVPSIMRYFNVGLIPFKINELTQSVNPIKLYEYWSVGVPVVSTRLSEIEGLTETGPLFLSNDYQHFVENINVALKKDCLQYVNLNGFLNELTWKNISSKLDSIVSNYEKTNG